MQGMAINMTNSNVSLARLLQLSSVSLPVGGYAFSQGMEYGIECGWINNSADVEEWIRLQLSENMVRVDLPLLHFVMKSYEQKNWTHLVHLNDLALASRETKELRLADIAMGGALLRLLRSLNFNLTPFDDANYLANDEHSFVVLFAYAAAAWGIDSSSAATGLIWSWLENQVAAATKLVPLGQTQAQQLLTMFQTEIDSTIALSACVKESEIGGGLPALAIASALHETQYSRLFRS